MTRISFQRTATISVFAFVFVFVFPYHNHDDTYLISELQGGRPPPMAPEALFQGIHLHFKCWYKVALNIKGGWKGGN